MGKRSVGNTYSEKLFEGPNFSSLCLQNGHCRYKKCRFRHYGKNPRDELLKKMNEVIKSKAQKRKKKTKKKRQREKKNNKKKNLKLALQREMMKQKSNNNDLPKFVGIHEHLLKKDVKNWSEGDNEVLVYVSEMKNDCEFETYCEFEYGV